MMAFFNQLVQNQGVSGGLFFQEVVEGEGAKFVTSGFEQLRIVSFVWDWGV